MSTTHLYQCACVLLFACVYVPVWPWWPTPGSVFCSWSAVWAFSAESLAQYVRKAQPERGNNRDRDKLKTGQRGWDTSRCPFEQSWALYLHIVSPTQERKTMLLHLCSRHRDIKDRREMKRFWEHMPTAIHTHAPQRKTKSERKYKCVCVCVCVCVCGRKYAASLNFLATRQCWYQHLTEYVFVCLLINLTDNKDALFRNFWPIKNADNYFCQK